MTSRFVRSVCLFIGSDLGSGYWRPHHHRTEGMGRFFWHTPPSTPWRRVGVSPSLIWRLVRGRPELRRRALAPPWPAAGSGPRIWGCGGLVSTSARFVAGAIVFVRLLFPSFCLLVACVCGLLGYSEVLVRRGSGLWVWLASLWLCVLEPRSTAQNRWRCCFTY